MDSLNRVYTSIQWINSLFEGKERPKYLLDPLTAVIKIGMLKYKIPKTKIRICNNKISFSEPSVFQGVSRWMMGDSRSNIHYLYLPILYFCFLKHECHHKQSELNIPSNLVQVVEQFNQLAIDGLQELKKTYLDTQNDLVINCLDLYLLMLGSEDETSIRQRYEKITITTKNTYREFLKCWNAKNIELVQNLFDGLEQNTESEFYVSKTLETLDNYLEAVNDGINRLREPQ